MHTKDLPKSLRTSLDATLQHIHLIQEKEARLANARRGTLEQALHQIGTHYRTGQLTEVQLCSALAAVRASKQPGAMNAWDEIVGAPWKRVAQRAKQLPNGPEGSWVGEYPIPTGNPAPLSGSAVVYVLFDDGNEPCYVGSTHTFRARLRRHTKDGKHFVRWQAHPCRDREHAYLIEDRLLRQHKPYLNQKASR
ncbi:MULTISPECIES: GIY-YIG nuclease family protein [unclassified Streptomyces]|uniref:GIY-YIG nuclease family protein n=1 Tax=unclassified Streptomyces TaxID=2593676 RepID=UPI00081F1EC3|nr:MULTISPECIES: GIY-YIG nuclease family protein [unclassified Streptomyces]MYZ37497.1 hypothetical protein [Streptomyces sp. SID4917]SCF91788.1 hypothetical protein GA0115259_104823 [Streptomyces sp. MnatMP-M17]